MIVRRARHDKDIVILDKSLWLVMPEAFSFLIKKHPLEISRCYGINAYQFSKILKNSALETQPGAFSFSFSKTMK